MFIIIVFHKFLIICAKNIQNDCFSGLKLAQEAQVISGPKLVDYKKVVLEDATIASKVKVLRKEVEVFAEKFPIPSFHEL